MSFDSFQASGNSPGPKTENRARRIAMLGFGTVGSAGARLTVRTKIPGLDLTSPFDDQSLQEQQATGGVRFQPDQVRLAPDATGYAEAA